MPRLPTSWSNATASGERSALLRDVADRPDRDSAEMYRLFRLENPLADACREGLHSRYLLCEA